MIGAAMVVPTIPVSDLDRAREFYGTALELELLWENPASIQFRAGPSSEISTFRRPGLTTEHTLAHVEVGDISATVRELEDRGVVFTEYTAGPLITTGQIARIGPALGAWFRDPDGNYLGLRQADVSA